MAEKCFLSIATITIQILQIAITCLGCKTTSTYFPMGGIREKWGHYLVELEI